MYNLKTYTILLSSYCCFLENISNNFLVILNNMKFKGCKIEKVHI